MTYDAGHPCCAEYGQMKREIERLRAAIYKAGVMLSQGMSKMAVENHLREAYTNDPNANHSR
jgi:hypothetical protein